MTSYTSGSRSDRHGRTSPENYYVFRSSSKYFYPTDLSQESYKKKKPVSDNLPHRRTNVASHFSIEMRRAGPDLVNFVQQRARESTAWFRGVGAHSPTIQFGFSLSYMCASFCCLTYAIFARNGKMHLFLKKKTVLSNEINLWSSQNAPTSS